MGYSSCFDTTDAQIVRPYKGYTSQRARRPKGLDVPAGYT